MPELLTEVRADPEFTYMDIARHQYIGVWPADHRAEWKSWAQKTRAVFDNALGRDAPSEAREIGADVDVRAVFGWSALVEKILARQAGMDDRTLELVKLSVMRTSSETPVPGTLELRLVAVDDESLLLAWLGGDEDEPGPAMRVPRQLLADIDADRGAWQSARDRVGEGDVVDFQRDMLVPV